MRNPRFVIIEGSNVANRFSSSTGLKCLMSSEMDRKFLPTAGTREEDKWMLGKTLDT